MTHTHVRDANVVGAFALAVADRVQAAAERAGGHGASGPAAQAALAELPAGERAALVRAAERALASMAPDGDRICRLCDTDACGRPRGCPVTSARSSAVPAALVSRVRPQVVNHCSNA